MTQKEQLKTDERYMRMALVEAEAAGAAGEIPIGAVISYFSVRSVSHSISFTRSRFTFSF